MHLLPHFFQKFLDSNSNSNQIQIRQVSELPARELLPGDVVELKVGEKVPADTRILALHTTTLRAEQASLTGEFFWKV